MKRPITINLTDSAYDKLREKSKNAGKAMKVMATNYLEKLLSDEYYPALLKIPKNLSPEELRIWLNENVEILMSKLC